MIFYSFFHRETKAKSWELCKKQNNYAESLISLERVTAFDTTDLVQEDWDFFDSTIWFSYW